MLRLFGGEKLGCPRTLFIILLTSNDKIIGFLEKVNSRMLIVLSLFELKSHHTN